MLRTLLVITFLISSVIADDYQDWLNSQNNQYNSYKKSMDEEFSDMLKKDWESFKSMSNPSAYKKPKPTTTPIVKKTVIVPKEVLKKSPIVKPKVIVKKKIVKPIIVVKKVTKKSKNLKKLDFRFYSTPIILQYDKKIYFPLNQIDKKSISLYWEKMSKTKYKDLIKQIKIYNKKLALNDWAKFQLLYKIGKEIYHNSNQANLFSWFMLVKMGYDTKVGYNSNKIYLLSTIKHSLYQISYFTLKGKKYYILTPNGKVGKVGNIYTYAGEYPKAKKQLSFLSRQDVKFYTNLKTKELKFNYNNKQYKVDAQYSQDLIDFYKTFPQSDYDVYFESKKSTPLSNSILTKLEPLVKGRSEIDAVNFLLRFVQKSFRYKTDQKQFNYEKVMFPEETIYYPYSDCEDRAIMFAYLVRNLLNLDVVGVKYSDHLATAVAFSSKIDGSSFKYKGKRYTISDPTYINANAGMAMPKYKHSKFEIISLR